MARLWPWVGRRGQADRRHQTPFRFDGRDTSHADIVAAGDVDIVAQRAGDIATERDGDTVDEDEDVDVGVKVLGPLDVRVHERAVVWGGMRHRALFQYLLLHPGPVHREELMELLWPGHSYDSARNNLNVCTYGLRRSLQCAGSAHSYVIYHAGCYSLNTTDVRWSVDRERFLRHAAHAAALARDGHLGGAAGEADRACALYRGPLFQDDPAVEWFAAERRSLREQYLELLGHEAVWSLQLGDLDGARRCAAKVLIEDPCRESGHRLLMRCHAYEHHGDLVARQFQRCVATLRAELGISPTAETVRLYETLVDSRPLDQSNGDHSAS